MPDSKLSVDSRLRVALDLVHERGVCDRILAKRRAVRSHLRQDAIRPREPGVIHQQLRERPLQHIHPPLQVAEVLDNLGVNPLDGSLPTIGEVAHQLRSLLKRRRLSFLALGPLLQSLRALYELDERPEVVGEFLLDEGIGLRRELFVKELERFVTERLPAAVLVVLEEDRSSLPDNRADCVKVVKQEHRTALLPWKHLGHL
mmetsp:Transcript_1064/g.4352  ORF Transcript_1064/g.4352 Transcript_1064/m.4352 type:complete len:202 (+) Transcript_1064:50-655(+)